MWRNDAGIPLGDIVIVTWWRASGNRVQKSQLFVGLRIPVLGSRFTA